MVSSTGSLPATSSTSKASLPAKTAKSNSPTSSASPGEPGSLVKPQSGKVLGTVVSEGRADKILVFHFKRKKQYKKLQGHRQGYTQVRISEIQVDGNSYTA